MHLCSVLCLVLGTVSWPEWLAMTDRAGLGPPPSHRGVTHRGVKPHPGCRHVSVQWPVAREDTATLTGL